MNDKSEKQAAISLLEKEGLLSGFLDGELTEAQRERVCLLVDSVSRSNTEADWQSLRSNLQSFVRAKSSTGSKAWNAWESIEASLTPYSSKPSLRDSIAKWFAAPGEVLEYLLRPQIAASVFACSFALVVASVWNVLPGDVDSNQSIAVAKRATPKSDTAALQLVAHNSTARVRVDGRTSEFVSNGFDSNVPIAFAGSSRPRSNQTLVAQSYNPRGLRIGAADIDWIRAKSHIDIVPAADDSRPPVIWVRQKIANSSR